MSKLRVFFLVFIVLLSLIAVPALVCAEVPASCPAGLSNYWKLDEASAPFVDLGGTDATCSVAPSACPQPAEGKVDGALSFNGTDQGLTAASEGGLANWQNQSFSIEAWVNTSQLATALPAAHVVVGRKDAGMQWWIGLWGADPVENFTADVGKPVFVLQDKRGAPNLAFVTGANRIDDGQWHHLVGVKDDAMIHLYVDGSEAGSSDISGLQNDFTSGEPVTIGWLNEHTGTGENNYYHFGGLIDEVALYSTALTADVIAQQAATGAGYCDIQTSANQPPSAPVLLTPEANQTGVDSTVDFTWNRSSDPDNDPVNYTHCYWDDVTVDFPVCTQVQETAAAAAGKGGIYYSGILGASGLFLFGMVFAGSKGRKGILGLLAVLMLTGAVLVSCGGGGGGDVQPEQNTTPMKFTVTDLQQGTTYYWKVIADDGKGGISESETRAFTTK